jgi:hypothetical protein
MSVSFEKISQAWSIPRKRCSCGGNTVIDVIPQVGGNDWYVRCLNHACPRDADVTFKDPVEAVNYWNAVGWEADRVG